MRKEICDKGSFATTPANIEFLLMSFPLRFLTSNVFAVTSLHVYPEVARDFQCMFKFHRHLWSYVTLPTHSSDDRFFSFPVRTETLSGFLKVDAGALHSEK